MNVKVSDKTRSQKTAVSSLKMHFREELKELKDKSLLRKVHTLESPQGPQIAIRGRNYINFSSNDYLNLSNHREVVKAAIVSLYRNGFGSGSSRLLSGTYEPHIRLEKLIAKFKNTSRALLFNSGYAANTGIIPAITSDDSVIFSDELNHASIIDGIRLSKARLSIFGHRDMSHLEKLLKQATKLRSVGRKVIITDTVFSMDGDIAPLNIIHRLSKEYDAIVMTDDAHGMGVLGETGRGGLEHFGIKDKRIIQMGTLSKAAGSFGAFVAGQTTLIDLLLNKSRSLMYSTSLPPSVVSASAMALHIMSTSSQRLRKRLWANRNRLFEGLSELGYNTLQSESPIIPILTGNVKDTLQLSTYLMKCNIFAPAIRPPTVPEDSCRIRFSVTAGHAPDDIDQVIEALRKY